jgi:GNAT superfamily N-acetyltransferase
MGTRRARSASSSASSRSPRRGRRPPAEWGTLRLGTEKDLPTLLRHRRRMFVEIRRRSRREMDEHDLRYRRWARAGLRSGELRAYVVEGPSGRPAGSGAVWLAPQQPRPGRYAGPRMPYILSMYTERWARGHGVASRIVRAMVDWATAEGFARIYLHASDMGRPVYERLGFVAGNEMRLELPGPSARRR